MATLTFDEQAVLSIMARHKVPKAHAAAMVEVFHEVHVDDGALATKRDIGDLEARLTNTILRAQITTIVASVGLTSTIVGVIIALVQTMGG